MPRRHLSTQRPLLVPAIAQLLVARHLSTRAPTRSRERLCRCDRLPLPASQGQLPISSLLRLSLLLSRITTAAIAAVWSEPLAECATRCCPSRDIHSLLLQELRGDTDGDKRAAISDAISPFREREPSWWESVQLWLFTTSEVARFAESSRDPSLHHARKDSPRTHPHVAPAACAALFLSRAPPTGLTRQLAAFTPAPGCEQEREELARAVRRGAAEEKLAAAQAWRQSIRESARRSTLRSSRRSLGPAQAATAEHAPPVKPALPAAAGSSLSSLSTLSSLSSLSAQPPSGAPAADVAPPLPRLPPEPKGARGGEPTDACADHASTDAERPPPELAWRDESADTPRFAV